MKHLSALALVIGLLALLPAVASAQDASEGYGAVAGVENNAAAGGGDNGSGGGGNVAVSDNAAAGTGAGDLPFTGLDLGLIAGAGGLLLIGGLAMRRVRME